MQAMGKMMAMQMQMQNNHSDPMENIFEIMTEQAKLSDEMHKEKGVDEEEFN